MDAIKVYIINVYKRFGRFKRCLMPIARSICLGTLRVGATKWLWPKVIPAGCLVAFDGDPGCGKSMLTVDLAARLSRGDPFPDGTSLDRPRRTLFFNAEDDFEDTILPRLRAARADLDHIFTMRGETGQVGGRAMRLPRDASAIARTVRKECIDLIVIDPLVAFLDEHFSVNSDQFVRRALQPLADLNRATHSTTLMVRHLNKNSDQKALYRGSGSIGVIGAARAGLLATVHPHRKGCYLLTANKMNVGEKPPALIYGITQGDSATIEWLGEGEEPITADAALHPEEADTPGIFRAMGWLRTILRDGPRLASEVILEATAAGISERTLERAKRQAGIQSHYRRVEEERSWIWASPDYKDEATLEMERLLEPLPEIKEVDADVQAKLSKAGRAVLDRERIDWAEKVLKARVKLLEESRNK